jgi:galactokinase
MLRNDELLSDFRARFGGTPRLYRAPGRVNLIGEHTDYNDGFAMPAAIQFQTRVAAAPRHDRRLRVRSVNFDEQIELQLPLSPSKRASAHWSDYVAGVAWALEADGLALAGADLLIDGGVPMGSGLSSSAALEVAVAFALADLEGRQRSGTELALLCQRAENEYVGMRCGVMDQFTSANGRSGCALLLDCRSLTSTPVHVGDAALLVCNTMIRHQLAGGEYNRRRADCEQGVAQLRNRWPAVRALRDVSMKQLLAVEAQLEPRIFRRCRHIITENVRVLAMQTALGAGELQQAGELMRQSHSSLRDDYEVSCAELDLMVRLAEGLNGVYGARMTGGGFGGCTINLVAPDAVAAVSAEVAAHYHAATGHQPEIYVCTPAEGVGRIGH